MIDVSRASSRVKEIPDFSEPCNHYHIGLPTEKKGYNTIQNVVSIALLMEPRISIHIGGGNGLISCRDFTSYQTRRVDDRVGQ